MKLLITLAGVFFSLQMVAAPGDTTRVRVHDKTDITWYGNYDVTGVFPDGNTSYRQILMHYTMGCASGGCSDWDYTTKIEILHKIGIDSVSTFYPFFTVDGTEIDTFLYQTNPTFKTQYNDTTLTTDTIYNEQLEVLWFENAETPETSNRSEYLYEAGYYNYQYNPAGLITDSTYVIEEGTYLLAYHEKKNPVDVLDPKELARVITPYGTYMRTGSNGYNNSWSHTFSFDITEFASLLKDTVKMRAFYGGWSSGFSVTLDFDFIEGTPPRNVTQINNVYRSGGGGWTYSNSAQFEGNLPSKTLALHENTTQAEMRITPTGHGFDNNVNCAEFCPRNYYLKVDGVTRFTQSMWKDDCGLNPIYPQGGTWIHNRANWCPGGEANDYTHEITPFIAGKDSIAINLDIQNYAWSGTQAPSYIIDAQFIEYGDFNFTNDAAISDVIAPSNKKAYSRRNPICGMPVLKLKNYGGDNLTTVDIKYHFNGNEIYTYEWNGNLSPLQEVELTLPLMSNFANTSGTFYAWTENPNGTADENPINDKYTSAYSTELESYINKLSLRLRTNKNGYETSWQLFDQNNNLTVSGSGLSSNTTYEEYFDLENGCYTLKINDSANDGLSWWANPDQGTGFAKLRFFNVIDAWNFKPDFGTEIRFPFVIDDHTSIFNQSVQENGLEVFPNPSMDGTFNVKFESALNENNGRVTVSDLTGKMVVDMQVDEPTFKVDLSNAPKGVYILKFHNDQTVMVKELMIE